MHVDTYMYSLNFRQLNISQYTYGKVVRVWLDPKLHVAIILIHTLFYLTLQQETPVQCTSRIYFKS